MQRKQSNKTSKPRTEGSLLAQAIGLSGYEPTIFLKAVRTDHRINLTLYKLDEVIEGDLASVVEPLVREHQADQLQQLADG